MVQPDAGSFPDPGHEDYASLSRNELQGCCATRQLTYGRHIVKMWCIRQMNYPLVHDAGNATVKYASQAKGAFLSRVRGSDLKEHMKPYTNLNGIV